PVDASYVDALPPAIRMIYNALKPAGHGTLLVEINRQRQGEMPRVQATVDIAHGRFTFFLFPYPARCHAGRIEIDFDPANHVEVARIENIEGSGPPAGPNAKARFTVNGAIGPFNGDAGGDFTVDGYGVRQEPALTAALPPQGRAALARLDAENARNLPQFVVNFHTRVHRNPGPVPSSGPNWDVVTDIDLTDGVGMPVDFPYLLRHATGHLRVGPDVIQIANLTARHGRGTVTINGAIRWNDKGVLPDLQVAALNLPVDAALIHAIDAKRPTNLAALNLNGRLDAIGRIFHTDSQPMAADMHLNLRDGVIPARDGTAALSQINAKMHLTPTSLEVMDLTAQHRDALILAHGAIDFSQGQAPRYTVLATADDLALDQSLYDLLPRASQRQWDAVRPEGTVNVLLTLDTRNPGAAEDQEAGATTRPGSGLQLLITPRQLSVTPQVAPYRLDHVAGAVSIAPDGVELRDISGQHGDAWINLDGRGVAGPAGMRWDVRLSGTDVPVDEQLLNATPGPLADVIRSLRLTGNIGFDFSQLSFLQTDGNARTQPIGNDADFNARVWSDAADMNVGVPLTDVKGQMTLEGTIRGGALASMIGGVKADSLKVAGRPAQDLSVLISRPPDAAILHFAKLQATLGGGQVAGDVAMSLPDSGLSRYVLSLELHDADVHQVAGTDDPKISGRISASLNLKGTWNDPSDRRGSGSVLVSDSQMYRIPLLLGMMQITNLSLPINSPFEEAAARYDVSGQEVVLEEIQIKGKDMSMEGGGHIDFDTRKVSLSLSTNNPNALNIPWVGPIWNGAQQELLRIHVDGTLQEPKISATSFDTFTTTIDHVLKGE
ncbi:MAG TPA: AsmA-like C-terminal domain-containing protein, partial [Tepidisphaeraceae bacterium]|nr:AsmA-like C-terminal domain-containing protein [Tepidisphaeraceae bacterium]